MNRILRYAFVVLLSLAMLASGTTLGLAQMAHAKPADHAHQANGHGGHAHHHGDHQHGMAQTAADDEAPPTGDHPSKTCCSACMVVSALPGVPDATVTPVVTQALYANPTRFDVSFAVPIDPGIPKRIG